MGINSKWYKKSETKFNIGSGFKKAVIWPLSATEVCMRVIRASKSDRIITDVAKFEKLVLGRI